MLTFIYDAFNGTPYRDGDADRVIAELLSVGADPAGNVTIIAATDNVLNALRVAMRRGQIPVEQITIIYRKPDDQDGPACDQTLRLYRNGGIRPWPRGFADYPERWLIELF